MLVKNLATNTDRYMITTGPDILVESIEKSTSSNSRHCTKTTTFSFSDPLKTSEKEFQLQHLTNLPNSVSKCQGNCSRPIKVKEVMVVQLYGRNNWTDKSTGKENTKFGLLYIKIFYSLV